jgi:hypothetical protein
MDPTWDRRPTSETAPAPTKKLDANPTNDVGVIQASLARVETILDRIIETLSSAACAR